MRVKWKRKLGVNGAADMQLMKITALSGAKILVPE